MPDLLRVHCPSCHRSFQVPPSKRGKSAKCPCGTTFKLEDPKQDEAEQEDLYALAEDDLPAVSNYTPPPLTPSPTPAPSARRSGKRPSPAGGNRGGNIGGYSAEGGVGIGLGRPTKRIAVEQPVHLGRGALLALAGAVVGVIAWYLLVRALPAGTKVPVGLMAVVLGALAGLGMGLGAIGGNSRSGLLAAVFALAGIGLAKALIITTIILPNADERAAQIEERDFGSQVKEEDIRSSWRRDDLIEQLTVIELGGEQAYEEAGPDTIHYATVRARSRAKELTDDEVAQLERERDVREGRMYLEGEEYARLSRTIARPSDREQRIWERQAEEFAQALSDDEVLQRTAGWRRERLVERLVQAEVEARLEQEAGGEGNPPVPAPEPSNERPFGMDALGPLGSLEDEDFDDVEEVDWQRQGEIEKAVRAAVLAMSPAEQDRRYDELRSAKYDVQVAEEVAGARIESDVRDIAGTATTLGEMVACSDFLFIPLGLITAFGLGMTGRPWGRG